MEILILHPGALGDIILALPAIAMLRERYRSARVTIAGNSDCLAVVARRYADSIVSLSTLPLHRLYTVGRLSRRDAHFWGSFDLIVSWTGVGDRMFLQKLKAANPRVQVAAWHPGCDERRHVSQIFADSMNPEGLSSTRVPPAPVEVDPEWRLEAARWLSGQGCAESVRFVSVHPGAGSPLKRWPEDRFVQVVHHLILREERKVLLVGGPAESGLAERIARLLPSSHSSRDVLMCISLPLRIVAALVDRSEFFIGNDSGIAHLAAALGVPSVVVFGPTDPIHWAPLSDSSTVLRDPRGCDACNSGTGPHSCLFNISADHVIQSVRMKLHGPISGR